MLLCYKFIVELLNTVHRRGNHSCLADVALLPLMKEGENEGLMIFRILNEGLKLVGLEDLVANARGFGAYVGVPRAQVAERREGHFFLRPRFFKGTRRVPHIIIIKSD